MPKVSDIKQSKYLAREDVNPPILVTIKGYEHVNVAMENQAPEMKWALTFLERDVKPMVLNQINGVTIESITGSDDFDDWIGKKIVLFDDPNVMFGTKKVGGVRVRAPKGQAAPVMPEEELPF
jgi:hypothetical protein